MDDRTPKDASDTTGAGIEAIVETEKAEGLVTDEKRALASEKEASGLAKAVAAMIIPAPGAGRYDGDDNL